MSQKAFKDITIKDITERADLNRGTFYLHYSDTYELLMSMENDVLDDFQEMIDTYLMTQPGNSAMPILVPVVHYIVENEEICRNLFENDASHDFNNKFKTLVHKNGSALLGRLFPMSTTVNSNYFLAFVTGGLIGVIKKWLDDGMLQTEEEIAKIGNEAVLSMARAFFTAPA